MKHSKWLQALVVSALTMTLVAPIVRAAEQAAPVRVSPQTSYGAIVGVLTDSAKLPVARATVTAVRVDGTAIRATVSGNDGVYTFADLSPGAWSISATVEGYPEVVAPELTVVASKATRHDIVMNVPGTAPAPAAAQAPAMVAAVPAVPTAPLGLQAPEAAPQVDNETPFAFADFTWMNATPRNKAPAFDTKFFTPDIRLDVNYMYDNNHPQDHTIVGATESFRSGEFQVEQISFGGDFHWENVRGRILTMYGLFGTTTPRNDASSGNIGGVGQWDLQDAYKYVSEANAGYHFDVNHGLNIDAGIFVSYIGFFSYYNYDNWTYQPSYVSSNTPWCFNGMRVQWFPTNKLKIEPWFINGWQSYAKYNGHPGLGGQIKYVPKEWLSFVFNNYGMGTDELNNPGRSRIHTDNSVEVRYFNQPESLGIDKAAFTFTIDAGCEYGGTKSIP